jgi:hypothetical protein
MKRRRAHRGGSDRLLKASSPAERWGPPMQAPGARRATSRQPPPTSVGQHRHDGVGAVGELVHAVLLVPAGVDQGQEALQLNIQRGGGGTGRFRPPAC